MTLGIRDLCTFAAGFSPTALKAGDANNVVAQGEGFKYPAYAAAPVGVGPYKLEKYDEANKTVTLVANDAYFGEKPKTPKIVFKIIPDESTRRQELKAGSIDAYDLPNPVDWKGKHEVPGLAIPGRSPVI